MAKLILEPPGPGCWDLDDSHFDRPLNRYGQRTYCDGVRLGSTATFIRSGIPIRCISVEFVQGFPYYQVQPLIGSPAQRKLPSRSLFNVLLRIHPTLRKRRRSAERYFLHRLWEEDVSEWDTVTKPTLFKRFHALEKIELGSLSDEQLIDHLQDCTGALRDNMYAHFYITAATYIPVGDFLAHVTEWTSIPVHEVLQAMLGTSGTDNASERLLRNAAQTIADDSKVRELLFSDGSPEDIVQRLCATPGPVGEACSSWYQWIAPRCISTGDLTVPTGQESPELLVEHLRYAVDHPMPQMDPKVALEKLRDQIPANRRTQFDHLFETAHSVYRLRDERSTLLDNWISGILRLALLEVGSRMTTQQRLEKTEHVFDIDEDEMRSLFLGGVGPTPEELRDRSEQRLSQSMDDVPKYLGGLPAPVPPAEYFPREMGRMVRAILAYTELLENLTEPASTTVLMGIGASAGESQGPVRIVQAAEDFAKVRPGDILVARTTMPAYNVLLPIIAGIVTDRGGALCHAAIVAREYGIPAVVGTRSATKDLEEGTTIRINGSEGTVTTVP